MAENNERFNYESTDQNSLSRPVMQAAELMADGLRNGMFRQSNDSSLPAFELVDSTVKSGRENELDENRDGSSVHDKAAPSAAELHLQRKQDFYDVANSFLDKAQHDPYDHQGMIRLNGAMADKLSHLTEAEARYMVVKTNRQLEIANAPYSLSVIDGENGEQTLQLQPNFIRGIGPRHGIREAHEEPSAATPPDKFPGARDSVNEAAKVLAGKEPLSKEDEREAYEQLAKGFRALGESRGAQYMAKSIEQVNSYLKNSGSDYSLDLLKSSNSENQHLALVDSGVIVDVEPMAPRELKVDSEAVQRTAEVILYGSPSEVEQVVGEMFERTDGDQAQFNWFNQTLARELADEGIEVKFSRKEADSISFHKAGTEYGVEFELLGDEAPGVFKTQPYEWLSKLDAPQVKAADIMKGLRKTRK